MEITCTSIQFQINFVFGNSPDGAPVKDSPSSATNRRIDMPRESNGIDPDEGRIAELLAYEPSQEGTVLPELPRLGVKWIESCDYTNQDNWCYTGSAFLIFEVDFDKFSKQLVEDVRCVYREFFEQNLTQKKRHPLYS